MEDEEGFSAFAKVAYTFIVARGATFDDFIDNLVDAVNFSFEEEGFCYSLQEISLVSSQAKGVSLLDAYTHFCEAEA